jgi:hypothetical protein
MLNMVKCLESECFMATTHSAVLTGKCQCKYGAFGQTLQQLPLSPSQCMVPIHQHFLTSLGHHKSTGKEDQ